MNRHDPAAPRSPARRQVLKVSGLAMGGMLIGTGLPPLVGKSFAEEVVKEGPGDQPLATDTAFGAFIRIGRDSRVTLISPKIEMGQGAQSGLAMLVAEELEVPLSQVTIEEAPPNEALYGDKLLNFQATGGSTSIRANWDVLRRAGAAGRVLLIQAAADRWKVPAAQCRAESGAVLGPGARRFEYGQLVDAAAKLPVPQDVPLKTPEQFRLIGKPVQRLDTPHKVTGAAKFTVDLQLPGMKTATVVGSPVYGCKPVKVDDSAARAIPGVRDVVSLSDAVAVVGDHMWAVMQGARALIIEWQAADNANLGTAQIEAALRQAASRDGALANQFGDIDRALADASKTFDAEYEMPFLAHAALEPMSCVAQVRPDACELWVGTQVPVIAQQVAAKASGLPPEKIVLHNQLIGGGFGRRLEADFIGQAVEIARQVPYPVKLVWTREQDTTHDLYRPHYLDRFSAALDDRGMPLGWKHTITGASVLARFAPASVPPDGLDGDAVEVSAKPIYRLQHLRVRYVPEDPKAIRVSWWRGVGALRGSFVMESFVDELAQQAGKDPLEYRMTLLAEHPRTQGVLKLAADKAGWAQPLPAGSGRGVAVQEVFGSHVATVVQLQTAADGGLRIQRIVVAVDCGLMVNPVSVHSQIEGGTLFGLSAALYNEVTIEQGRVQQTNFHDYRQLRISEAPPVEVHVVPSAESPGGIGEAGTALIAPALVNALYAASGKRVRRLPVVRHGFHVV